MNIKGLDYNTGRDKLVLPEYGREIQKMVDYARELPTKGERLRCAKTIVRMMLTKVPHIQGNAGYEQTLWDHLYLMADGRLDIDWPADVSGASKIQTRPAAIPLPKRRIRLRHYGKFVDDMLQKLKAMPEGKERSELVRRVALQMKRDLLTWGHGSAADEKVAADMAMLTDGAVQLDLATTRLDKVTAIATDEGKKGRRRK